MSAVTWGMLEKSLVDDETIEEAITRLISAHNDDEEAHLGTGQSLQSHKASEIIDHLAASIILDKLADFSVDFKKLVGSAYMLITCFEYKTAWNWIQGSGAWSVVFNVFDCMICSGGSYRDYALLSSHTSVGDPILKFTKDSFFQTTILFQSVTDQFAYFVAGEVSEGFGFKVANGTLYSYHNDGSDVVTTEISDIDLDTYNVYRAVFSAADSKIYFYVNGVLEATHSTYIPSGDSDYFFSYYIEAVYGGARTMRARDLIFSCER
jgi:hypothetical protein